MKNIIRSTKHLNYIRSQPCMIGQMSGSQACHIRILTDGGTGIKPSDFYVLPMEYRYHKISHDIGEARFYKEWQINPFIYAQIYVKMSPCEKVNNKKVLDLLNERAKTYERIYKN